LYRRWTESVADRLKSVVDGSKNVMGSEKNVADGGNCVKQSRNCVKSRGRDKGGQRESRGRQDDGMWREERSDDVAVDACCETKSGRGKLDLCIFHTLLCSAQLVASLLLSRIL